MPELIVTEFGTYIMPTEPISMVHFEITFPSNTSITTFEFSETKP
jgi:hypothetical protein